MRAHRHIAAGLGRTLPAALSMALAWLLIGCGGAAAGPSASTAAEPRTLTIAEPVHGTGYLPLYVGISRGTFKEQGLDVKTVTLQGGGAHTNAVLTGQAWAFIGGPEHNAFVRLKSGGDANMTTKAIVNVVNRGNNYLVARSGLAYSGDMAGFLRGKTIVTGAYGGTPNSVTRYLLKKHGLKEGSDVKLIESADASAMVGIVQKGGAQIAVVSEPILGKGIAQGVWGQPFYNVPSEFGPYAYSTINVRQDAIDKDAATVERFVRGMMKALEIVRSDRDRALKVARAEFPTMDPTDLEATLTRSYEDHLWEYSGRVTPQSVQIAFDVVREAGVLKDKDSPVKYGDVVDMRFVDKISRK